MARLRVDKPVRAELLDELVAAGLAPLTPAGGTIMETDADGGGAWLEVPAADEATARGVAQAHDPAVYAQAEADAKHTFQQAVDFLQTYYKTPNPQITVDQTKNAVKALTVVARRHNAELAEGG